MDNNQQSPFVRISELSKSAGSSPSEVTSALYLLVSAVIGFFIIRRLTTQEIMIALGTIVWAVCGMWLLAMFSRSRLVVRSLKPRSSHETGGIEPRVRGDVTNVRS